MEHDSAQFLSQSLSSQHILRHGRINGVFAEVYFFSIQCVFDSHAVINVFLTPVFDAHVAESQLDIFSQNHIFRIGSSVHDVDFGNHSDSAFSFRVQLSGHL